MDHPDFIVSSLMEDPIGLKSKLSLNVIEMLLILLHLEQNQIRQLLKELPDQGLLCLHMEI